MPCQDGFTLVFECNVRKPPVIRSEGAAPERGIHVSLDERDIFAHLTRERTRLAGRGGEQTGARFAVSATSFDRRNKSSIFS